MEFQKHVLGHRCCTQMNTRIILCTYKYRLIVDTVLTTIYMFVKCLYSTPQSTGKKNHKEMHL